jgi:hypothetical protein
MTLSHRRRFALRSVRGELLTMALDEAAQRSKSSSGIELGRAGASGAVVSLVGQPSAGGEHLAVRATRYGCTDDETSQWSSKAFQLLRRRYPKSEWAAKTKYHY